MIEAVPEEPALKAEILARASKATDGIIATNTSSLPIAGLAESVETPERFLGVHWFNPPEWTPGIEVIRGPVTDEVVVTRVITLLRDVGKQPAEVADRAGFVSNRLQMALLREALAIVAEGQTTREDLDTRRSSICCRSRSSSLHTPSTSCCTRRHRAAIAARRATSSTASTVSATSPSTRTTCA